jgi:5-methylcytosine-specific restriction endonuclease McrA
MADFSREAIEWIWNRDGGKCAYGAKDEVLLSGYGVSWQIDHILPVSRGGTNDLRNLTVSCTKHHRTKGERTATEFRAGLLLPDLSCGA